MSGEFDYILSRLEAIEARSSKHAEQLRLDMNAGFDRLAAKLDEHAKDDALVADRVLVIETQRAEEAKLAIKRGTWAGMLAAFGLTAGWELVQRIWKP